MIIYSIWSSPPAGAFSLFRENRSAALHSALRRDETAFMSAVERADHYHQQIESRYRTYQNQRISNIVQNIISKVPNYSRMNWKTHVIDSNEVNAFCTGGDRVYLYQGLIDKSPDEDALAFVMAHEIGHSIAGHVERQSRLSGQNKLVMILCGKLLGGVNDGMNAAFSFMEGRFSRDHEREADILGAWYCYQAGYDPLGGARFFERLMSMHGDSNFLDKLFGSHPALKERIKRVEQVGRFVRGEIEYKDLGQEVKYTLRVLEDSIVTPEMWGGSQGRKAKGR